MKMRGWMLAAAALLLPSLLALNAASDEYDIQLKPGTGLDAVEQNCAACHSLDYILMNSPFLDDKGWAAEVTKMVSAFGAPIAKADQDSIIAYLAANYAKSP